MRAYTEIEEEKERSNDTEITLGMSSVLGIFFGLVLVCGVFFGFGYSLGRGSSPSSVPASHTSSDPVPPKPASNPDLATSSSDSASDSADTATAPAAPAHAVSA